MAIIAHLLLIWGAFSLFGVLMNPNESSMFQFVMSVILLAAGAYGTIEYYSNRKKKLEAKPVTKEEEKTEKEHPLTTYMVIAALLIVGVFYWVALRPANIRRECSATVTRGSAQDLADEFGVSGNIFRASFSDEVYEACLHSHGL